MSDACNLSQVRNITAACAVDRELMHIFFATLVSFGRVWEALDIFLDFDETCMSISEQIRPKPTTCAKNQVFGHSHMGRADRAEVFGHVPGPRRTRVYKLHQISFISFPSYMSDKLHYFACESPLRTEGLLT